MDREPTAKRPRRESNASGSGENTINFPAWEHADTIIPKNVDSFVAAKEGNESFTCPISHTLMLNPVGLMCGHVFDESSVLDYIRRPPNDGKTSRVKCPTCRVMVPKSTLVPQHLVKALIGEKVKMRCYNVGCNQVMTYDRWEHHFKNACPHTRMLCVAKDEEGSNCGAVVTRPAKEAHELECPHRPVNCSHAGCSNILLRKGLKKHEEDCEFRIIECTCREKMAANMNPAHRASVCPEEEVSCTICSIKVKRQDLQAHHQDPQTLAHHLLALTSRLEKSEASNKQLKAHNKDLTERLERSLGNLKEDCNFLKNQNDGLNNRLHLCSNRLHLCERESGRLAQVCDGLRERMDGNNGEGSSYSVRGRRSRDQLLPVSYFRGLPSRRRVGLPFSFNGEYQREGGRSLSRSRSRDRSLFRSLSGDRSESGPRNRSESPYSRDSS